MESSVFEARVSDAAVLCERTGVPKFLGFLTTEESAQAEKLLRRAGARYRFGGGYDGAERQMLACLPDWCEEPDFPLCALTLRFREADVLTHRDFLGALMALGITRESVGDILVEPGRAVIFLKKEIAAFVTEQLDRVGSAGVSVSDGFSEPLPQAGALVPGSETVASLRLDCVVAALCRRGRTGAAQMIESGLVSVNSSAVLKGTKTVAAGDRISVRGRGRFVIDSVSGLSKKGRIVLKFSEYQ